MIKETEVKKQFVIHKSTFARTVETKIRQKIQGVSKKEKPDPDKIKHPKSGKGL